jgi:hypothetical protein
MSRRDLFFFDDAPCEHGDGLQRLGGKPGVVVDLYGGHCGFRGELSRTASRAEQREKRPCSAFHAATMRSMSGDQNGPLMVFA